MAESWYPGHMAKAVSELRQSMKLIDTVIEIVDARAPVSTSNPDLAGALGSKPRITVLNKADLAEPEWTRAWVREYEARGGLAIPANCQAGEGIAEVVKAAAKASMYGAKPRRRSRTVVVGMPNVGKSSFINRVSRKASVRTGDTPGITRAKQWIVISPDLEMLDTPGIMPPRVDDPSIWFTLASLGCIGDTLYDSETLAASLVLKLDSMSYRLYREKHGIPDELVDGHAIVEHIARKRGCMKAGGVPDIERASDMFIRDFRSGKYGRITMDRP